MLISNKKHNIFKKITLLIVFFTIFLGCSVPKITRAAGGAYYFDVMSAQPSSKPAFGPYTDAKNNPDKNYCETSRGKIISDDYDNGNINVDFSKCVLITKSNPTSQDVIAKSPLPWQTVQQIVSGNTGAVFWLMYHNADKQYQISQYPSKKDCSVSWSEIQSQNKTNILDKDCVTTKPTPPTGSVVIGSKQDTNLQMHLDNNENQPTKPDTITKYEPLAPLPNPDKTGELLTSINTADTCAFGKYLNIVIKLFFGICAVLAMIMIVIGGVQYMTTELISSKESAKHSITGAIFGFLLALSAYLLLNTINPKLLDACLSELPQATVIISPDDTSTGSDTKLCISTTNPPNPDSAAGTSMKSVISKPAMPEYITARDNIAGITLGKKYLITAQTAVEGFYSSSKSYTTNNPGNIGNTDDGKTKKFSTLTEGIQAQISKVVSGSGSYKIGSKPTCALGNESYQGYLYQYLRIYSTSARQNNIYLNDIIGYFADNGKKITGKTTMDQIYNMN